MAMIENECKHCMGISQNEIGETIVFCEEWDEGKNVTLGDCFGNCEWQEREAACVLGTKDRNGGGEVGRIVMDETDCADCLCRVCARNEGNDCINDLVKIAECECNCTIGESEIRETDEDCKRFIPDEF